MKPLSEAAVRHLREVADWPDLSGTHYEILERVARGGMGTVYRAYDHRLERDVALKVMSPESADADAIARIQREARVIARLEHPGIVPVHDLGTLPDGRIYYTMKLVRGLSLEEHLRDPPSRDELLRIFSRICEAVAFAHAHDVVHRDLKPSNVMVGPFGEVLVMDWGVAKLVRKPVGTGRDDGPGGSAPVGKDDVEAARRVPVGDAGGTEPGRVLGTPGYMAPEQAAGLAGLVDERADIYALGVILSFMLDGEVLLRASRPARRRKLPRPLAGIIRKATARVAADRYASVEELAADIDRFRAGLPVTAYREGLLDRAERVFNRYRTPIFLVLAYLLMRTLLLLFAQR